MPFYDFRFTQPAALKLQIRDMAFLETLLLDFAAFSPIVPALVIGSF